MPAPWHEASTTRLGGPANSPTRRASSLPLTGSVVPSSVWRYRHGSPDCGKAPVADQVQDIHFTAAGPPRAAPGSAARLGPGCPTRIPARLARCAGNLAGEVDFGLADTRTGARRGNGDQRMQGGLRTRPDVAPVLAGHKTREQIFSEVARGVCVSGSRNNSHRKAWSSGARGPTSNRTRRNRSLGRDRDLDPAGTSNEWPRPQRAVRQAFRHSLRVGLQAEQGLKVDSRLAPLRRNSPSLSGFVYRSWTWYASPWA